MRRKNFRYPVTSLAGSTPGNIFKIIKSQQTAPRYYLKLGLSFIVAIIFSFFNLLENLLRRKQIRNFKLKEPPLFIIGFNRSGTTLLHNLLCQDPESGYTTTLQTVFPSCFLTQQWWLGPVFNYLVPAQRPFDNVSMDKDFPQEEEFAMANLQPYSVYNFFLFPSAFDHFVDHDYFTEMLPAAGLAKWKKEYHKMMVKSLLNTKGTRYVSKNPVNIPRMKILKELYPHARFIFIYRDPYVVVESFYHFILAIFPGIQLQEVPADFSRRNVARFYSIAMTHYLEMKKKSSTPIAFEIRMEDFVKDKIGGLRNLYSALGIEKFEASAVAFENYLASNHYSRNESYEIDKETIQYVNLYATPIVEHFGYPLRTIPTGKTGAFD
ncbi:MAG TPA: sulfotransferase [Chitinophagales bacterium]|nr:sulfotransferase [Chitinophagales bacterium]